MNQWGKFDVKIPQPSLVTTFPNIWNDQLKLSVWVTIDSNANSRKSVNLKPCDDLFLFISNDFLQDVARGINSSTITVFARRELRSWFWQAILSGIFIEGFPEFYFHGTPFLIKDLNEGINN